MGLVVLGACGETATTQSQEVTTNAATTSNATSAVAAQTIANQTTSTLSATTIASQTTISQITSAVSQTTANQATATSNVATTKAAPISTLPPVSPPGVGGPAPTPAPPSVGQHQVTLQVPDKYKKGVFDTPRTLSVPTDFVASVYTVLPGEPRMLAYSPDGQLFATETGAGKVVLLKDTNGVASDPVTFAEGLDMPHGLAFFKDPADGKTYLYVAEQGKVSRISYEAGQQRATTRQLLVNNLPKGGNHRTRTLAFGPDNKMYVSVGSSCNVCEDAPLRADVLQFNPDGSGERVFAAGLRNAVGLAFNPTTGQLWETENGRDEIGNDMPPEEINILQDGKNYGWPYCYSNQVWDKDFNKRDQAFCNTTVPPALPMQAHSAPLGISFYTGKRFPSAYQGAAFVGFHGSWNRDTKTGYKVVAIVVQNGQPVSYQDFATGWLNPQTGEVWGRPVDPIMDQAGNLLVTDDQTGAIYKFSYQGQS